MKGLICFAAIFLLLSAICVADEIKGKITAIYAEGGTIEVSGVKIIAKKATIKNLVGMRCEISELKVGDRVEIDGVFSGPGEMLAAEIEREAFKHDQIEGKLEKVDGGTRTLLISGVTVNVSKDARIEGKDDKVISLKDLAVGYQVECKGTWTGSKEFSASKIELD
jgi:hypothetical protein